ncbi:MAG TPA: hypothetical protein VFO70_00475, partial [Chitinophagaceae bacterium]|nr:hypothetical protein [Chitinophagaceae bacterium]
MTLLLTSTLTLKAASNGVNSKRFYSPLTTLQIPTQQKPAVDTTAKPDSNAQVQIISTDTTRRLRTDSIELIQTTDSFILKLSKDSLDGPVKYQAEDSVVIMILEKKIFLYGKTQTDYNDITLKAPMVILDQQTQILTAVNSKDSLG